MSEESTRPPLTFYEAVGGEETFTRLVHRFYEEVAADPVLRAVYPAQDLGRPRSTCGCSSFSTGAGRPRTTSCAGIRGCGCGTCDFTLARPNATCGCAYADGARLGGADPALDAQLWDYLVMAAHSLVNVVPENLPGPSGRGDLGITPT